MQATDEYWMSHLRTSEAREDRQLLQKENLREHALRAVTVSIKVSYG